MPLSDLTANTRRRRAAWRVVAFGLAVADPAFATTFRTALNTGLQRLGRVEAAETMRRQADDLGARIVCPVPDPEGGRADVCD